MDFSGSHVENKRASERASVYACCGNIARRVRGYLVGPNLCSQTGLSKFSRGGMQRQDINYSKKIQIWRDDNDDDDTENRQTNHQPNPSSVRVDVGYQEPPAGLRSNRAHVHTCSRDSGVPCFFSSAHARIHTPFLDLKCPSACAKMARAVSTPPRLREFSASSTQVLIDNISN